MTAKKQPQHGTKGTPCNIVDGCTSGKPAFYVVGSKFACADHRDLAFALQKRHRTKAALPEVDFEPEIEAVEHGDEPEIKRLARMAQGG